MYARHTIYIAESFVIQSPAPRRKDAPYFPQLVARIATHYTMAVIVSFKHKGLDRLFHSGDASGILPEQVKRLRRILAILNAAGSPADFSGLPGLRPHPLKGQYRGYWSLSISGNWRVIFRFKGENVVDVNLTDYH